MAEMEVDIQGLDTDMQAKTASLKLAHTRLETRTTRPGMDLCRDEVPTGSGGEPRRPRPQMTCSVMCVCRSSTASWAKSIS